MNLPRVNLFPFDRQKFSADFLADLSRLLEAGLPLERSLAIIEEETTPGRTRTVIRQIRADILAGRSLSLAVKRAGRFFPEFLVGLLRVAEESGSLSTVLKEAAGYLENTRLFKIKILTQLTYPLLVAGAALFVFIFLGFFVIPNFEIIFTQNHLNLPALTRIIFTIFKLLRKFFLLIISGLAVIIWIFKKYFRKQLDHFLLNLPVASGLIKKISLSRFCVTMALLLKRGTALLEALFISVQTIDNQALRSRYAALPVWINRGLSLRSALEKTGFFPGRLKQMMAFAEETGSLEEVFASAGNHYQNEVTRSLQLLATLTEPAVTILVGILVALMMASVFWPIINLTSSLNI
jgi:general secretion pathway protein F